MPTIELLPYDEDAEGNRTPVDRTAGLTAIRQAAERVAEIHKLSQSSVDLAANIDAVLDAAKTGEEVNVVIQKPIEQGVQ